MSRLQDLTNHLIEMLTLYYTKQTQIPLDPKKYISLPDAELRNALKDVNAKAVAGGVSVRHSLLEYFRHAITVTRPLVNSHSPLSPDEEVKVINTLSRLISDCLLLLRQKTSLYVATDHCGLINLPTDPRSLSYDELDRSLLNPSSYVLFGSTIYYVELDKYPDPAAPHSSSSAAATEFRIIELKTVTDTKQLARLFTPNYIDATSSNLQEIRLLTGHEFKTQYIEVKGMYGSMTNTSSTSAFRTAILAPFGIKETSSEAEITAWIKKLVTKHQLPLQMENLQLLMTYKQSLIDSLQHSLDCERAKSAQLSDDLQRTTEELGIKEAVISEQQAENTRLTDTLAKKASNIEELQTQVSEQISEMRLLRTKSALTRVRQSEEKRYGAFFGMSIKPITIMPDNNEAESSIQFGKRMQYGSSE